MTNTSILLHGTREIEMEMLTVYGERASGNDGYSEYIYYCATEDEVKAFRSKFTSHADSSKAAHDETHEKQRQILENVRAVSDAVTSQHSCCTGGKVEQELAQLKEMVNNLLQLQASNLQAQR